MTVVRAVLFSFLLAVAHAKPNDKPRKVDVDDVIESSIGVITNIQDLISQTDGCWKDSYGRGVGTIPDACPGADKDGALCYPHCKEGYDGVGPVCWQNCPPAYRDDGAFCFKPSSYGRGAGYTSEGSCRNSNSQGCEMWGLLWYPKCAAGFYAFGCCVCSPVCPSGMVDIGISCAKHSYGRTAGYPMQCAAHLQYDAGLCYPFCNKNYYGVGPVCWGTCTNEFKYECGALCLKSNSCTDEVRDMVRGIIDLAVGIVIPGHVTDVIIDAGAAVAEFIYPLCKNVAKSATFRN